MLFKIIFNKNNKFFLIQYKIYVMIFIRKYSMQKSEYQKNVFLLLNLKENIKIFLIKYFYIKLLLIKKGELICQ
uniref:Uncharacterized protein n=1 Tax=Companilactobacillus formosensis TaxID=1617889 RepID=A0A2P4R5N6_9LACO